MCNARDNRRNTLPRLTFYPVILCLVLFSGAPGLHSRQEAAKKLFISSIRANGVPESMSKMVRERLEFSLYESFGREYRVFTDEDVSVMFDRAKVLMATGCDADNCQSELADAIDADEIIYGEVSSESSRIRLAVRTLVRDRNTHTVSKKSMVVLTFAESDLDHYCAEAAKKLINPTYGVRKPPHDTVSERITLSPVRLQEVKGPDIAIMHFTSSDAALADILAYLKKIVQEGDADFGNKQYGDALRKYMAVLNRIQSRLSPEKQARMSAFTDGVTKRCDAASAMLFRDLIEGLDGKLARSTTADEKSLKGILKHFTRIENSYNRAPRTICREGMAAIRETLNDRHDIIISALASSREKAGDALYGRYRFKNALNAYRQAYDESIGIRDSARMTELSSRLCARQKAALETGRNYLLSRVRAHADRAEYFNVRKKSREARKTLNGAGKLIRGDLIIFATPAALEAYNAVAGVLGTKLLSEKDDPALQAAFIELDTVEENCRKKDEERKKREEFTARGGGREKTIGGITFIFLPGGSFLMGSPEVYGYDDEHPRHQVELDGFWISRCEITRQQYMDITGNDPGNFTGSLFPVDSVSWEDAMEFCRKLSLKTGVKANLPTEAEWEYACRAGSATRYHWGDTINGEYCWYTKNSGGTTHPAGSRKSNAWGLFDMSGNVWEWCRDWYGEKYYATSPVKNPRGPDMGENRVLRGGSWNYDENSQFSANRDSFSPGQRNVDFGFRVVLPGP